MVRAITSPKSVSEIRPIGSRIRLAGLEAPGGIGFMAPSQAMQPTTVRGASWCYLVVDVVLTMSDCAERPRFRVAAGGKALSSLGESEVR